MLEQLPNILLCLSVCYATWGFFFAFLRRRGIDYVRHFWWTTGYFLLSAVLVSLLFASHIVRALEDVAFVPLVLLSLFMIGQVVWYVWFPHFVSAPQAYLEKHPDRYYLTINWQRLVSKSADIFAQQVYIVLLIFFLRDANLLMHQIVMVFGLLFFLLHIPLLALEFGAWPFWLFSGVIVIFSLIFPLLILQVPYGFVYTFIIHWMFYTATATIFWLRKANRRNTTSHMIR